MKNIQLRLLVVSVFTLLTLASCENKQGKVNEKVQLEKNKVELSKLASTNTQVGVLRTMGFDDLGRFDGITGWLSADVRAVKDNAGNNTRGLRVEVYESQYKQAVAFINADELGDLLQGIDHILNVKSNPTPFKMFQVSYKTRDDFEVTAFNEEKEAISYTIKAGHSSDATNFETRLGIEKLRSIVVGAQAKLKDIDNDKK